MTTSLYWKIAAAKVNAPELVERKARQAEARYLSLSIGSQRLLLQLHKLFERVEFASVNRPEIAAVLQHTKMHRYDVKLLNQLVEAGFVQVEKKACRMVNGYPHGSEFRYSMNRGVAWVISCNFKP